MLSNLNLMLNNYIVSRFILINMVPLNAQHYVMQYIRQNTERTGTIQTGTGITCKKSLVICVTQLAGGLLLKMLKYVEIMLNIF